MSNSAELVTLQDAVVLPMASGSSPACVKGGILDPTLKPLFHQCRWNAVHKGHREIEVVTDLKSYKKKVISHKKVKGVFLYAGPIFLNFGHFLAECIHRLWALEYCDKTLNLKLDGVIFLPQNARHLNFIKRMRYQLPRVYIEILDYLGVTEDKIKFQFAPSCFSQLVVPQQASYFRCPQPINQSYKEFLIRQEQRNKIHPVGKRKKLYVSRTNFSLRGAYAGEKYLETLFQKHGFEIFFPEKHSLVDQLINYKSADTIVFAEGGAIHVLELLGSIDAQIFVVLRRPNAADAFSPMLSARAKSVVFFKDVETLPSLYVPDNSDKAAHGSSISILKPKKLKMFLNSVMKLTDFDFNLAEFSQSVRLDLIAYYQHYRALDAGNEATKANALKSFKQKIISLAGKPSFQEFFDTEFTTYFQSKL